MRKIRNLALAVVATAAIVGGATACDAGSPAAAKPTAVAPRGSAAKAADLNAWATEAAPIITDIGNQSMKLADDPTDQVAGAALFKDGVAGLHMQHRSGNANLDGRWKIAMGGARKLAMDVRNYDMNAIVKDANYETINLDNLNKALAGAQ